MKSYIECMPDPLITPCLVIQYFASVQTLRSAFFNVITLRDPKAHTQNIHNFLSNPQETMKSKFLITPLLLLCSTPSFARQCWNARGYNIVDAISYNLSSTFTQGNNLAGQIKNITIKLNTLIEAKCEIASIPGINSTARAYVNNEPIVEKNGNYQFMRINDYLLGAMEIYDSAVNYFYPPTRLYMGYHPNVDYGKAFPIHDTDLTLRLKVVKPFVGNISIPSKTMFTVYVTTTTSDSLRYPVYTISYSGRIIAPQSCSIDSGKVLEVKFGDILASEFSQAGAGNKPTSIDPQTRSISVQCSNMNAAALLTLRVEAEKSQGDMLVSNNDDVGFKISDMNNNVLMPNNLNSVLPFTLDHNQQATVSIKAWPVSIIGNKPALGPFNSRAYIRIDFP